MRLGKDSVDPHALVSDCYASFSSILCQTDCSEKRIRRTRTSWTGYWKMLLPETFQNLRDTQPAQPEYHVTVTRSKHRVPRPPPETSLTYIPGQLVRAPEFEPFIGVVV
jgi:hypothetical protein